MKSRIKSVFIAIVTVSVLAVVGIQSANATQLVTNGGFETGDLTGWGTSAIPGSGPCPSDNRDWNVSTSGTATGCNTVANPSGSTWAAYAMNDGTGPLTYSLFQNIFVPLGTISGSLTFDWVTDNFYDSGRLFSATLNGNNLFSSSTYGSTGWVGQSFNVGSILSAASGTNITLQFDNYIPATWTGPAGMGLDNVSIQSTQSAVPVPATILLFSLGLVGLGFSRRIRN